MKAAKTGPTEKDRKHINMFSPKSQGAFRNTPSLTNQNDVCKKKKKYIIISSNQWTKHTYVTVPENKIELVQFLNQLINKCKLQFSIPIFLCRGYIKLRKYHSQNMKWINTSLQKKHQVNMSFFGKDLKIQPTRKIKVSIINTIK